MTDAIKSETAPWRPIEDEVVEAFLIGIPDSGIVTKAILEEMTRTAFQAGVLSVVRGND